MKKRKIHYMPRMRVWTYCGIHYLSSRVNPGTRNPKTTKYKKRVSCGNCLRVMHTK